MPGPDDPILTPAERRFATRAVLACVAVVFAICAFVATAALLEVGKVGNYFKQNKTFQVSKGTLSSAGVGQPQTLLLVGDDRRPPPKNRPNGFVAPHSNEMLLVRLDPSKPAISMLSIPRELRVPIFPHNGKPVTNRINFAYTLGGIQLMTETIKRVLGVSINHVVVITFPHFKQAVDEIGCVYSMIDRRYYHSNIGSAQQYFEVNLQPGYQRLCGDNALQFVAYRHGDTSLVRDARDQRFLLDVKGQYGPSLISQRDKFEQIMGRAVQTDIHGTDQILNLATLLAQVSGRPVRQVHFDVNIGPSFDTATPQQIQTAVSSFLNGVNAAPRRKIKAAISQARRRRQPSPPPGLSLAQTPAPELDYARAQAAGMTLPLEYPRVRSQPGPAGPDALRVYQIHDYQGQAHESYVAVIDHGTLGDFYDVQGTTWQDPPILNNPSQTVKIGKRTYGLFYSGDNLRLVAWRDGPGVYWIENTLTNAVPPAEMLAMAEQTAPVAGPGGPNAGNVHPQNFLPKRTSTKQASTFETVGGALGLLGIIGIVWLAVKWRSRRRSHRELRADLEQLAHAEARLEQRLEVVRRRQVQAARRARGQAQPPPRQPTPR